jgi:hypothetical protein
MSRGPTDRGRRWVLRSAMISVGLRCCRQEAVPTLAGDDAAAFQRGGRSASGGDAEAMADGTFDGCSGRNRLQTDGGTIVTPCCESAVALDGGVRTMATFPYAPPQTGQATNLVSDGTSLYSLVGTSFPYGQIVVRFPITCGAPTILASSGQGGRAFAVAGGHAYWATEQSILSVLATGGASHAVTTVASAPLDLAVHNDRLYWTDVGGQLSTVPVAGGTSQVLASGLGNLGGLAVDDSNVYLTQECGPPDASCPSPGVGTITSIGTGRLLSVSLGGGAVTTLVSQQLTPTSVIVDIGNIYWTNAGTWGRDTASLVPCLCACSVRPSTGSTRAESKRRRSASS